MPWVGRWAAEFPGLTLLRHWLKLRQATEFLGATASLYIRHDITNLLHPTSDLCPKEKWVTRKSSRKPLRREQTSRHTFTENQARRLGRESSLIHNQKEDPSSWPLIVHLAISFTHFFKVSWGQAHNQHLQSMREIHTENTNFFSTWFTPMTWDAWVFPRNLFDVSL